MGTTIYNQIKYFFFTLTLMPSAVLAQNKISGIILDKNNVPFEYATVVLSDSSKKFVKDYLTDIKGFFEIECAKGKYFLTITYINDTLYFKELTIEQNMDLGIIVGKQAKQLQEVLITVSKPIIKQDFDKLVFSVENSTLKKGYDGLEVLKRSPKLQVSSQGDLLIRNNPVMVLINGRRLNMSGQELNNYLATLNSENIKSIEIQTSGNAETDAENNGGAVNIILKKVPKGFQTTARNYYEYREQDYGRFFSGLNTQFSQEKWFAYHRIGYNNDKNKSNYNSSLNYKSFDGKNVNEGNNKYKNTSLNNTLGAVYYPNSKHEVGLEFLLNNNNSDRIGFENLGIFNPSLSSQSNNHNTNKSKTNFWNATLNYSYKTDSLGSTLKIISDVGKYHFDNTNEVATIYQIGSNNNNTNQFNTNSISNIFNFQIDRNKIISQKWKYLIGSKLLYINRDNLLNQYLLNNNQWQNVPTGKQDFENKEWIWANYFSVSHSLKEKHNFKLGLRSEYTYLNGNDFVQNTKVRTLFFNLFPSFYYGYTIDENKTISANYNRTIQRPSFRDLNPFVIKQNDFLFQIGNPDLKPQFSNRFDVTFQTKKYSTSLFANFSENTITGIYSNTGNIVYYQPQNFGNENQIGADFSYYKNIAKWFYLNFYSSVWRYSFNMQNANFSKFVFSNSLNMVINLPKNWKFDLSHSYTSNNQFRVTDAAYQYQMDLMLQKSFWEGNGIVRFYAEDIFNTQRDKNKSIYQNFDFGFYQKRITRSFTLMFIYTFKNKGKIDAKSIENSNDNKQRL